MTHIPSDYHLIAPLSQFTRKSYFNKKYLNISILSKWKVESEKSKKVESKKSFR